MTQSTDSTANPDSGQSILNREFILITLSGFVFFFNFHSFLMLPLYIKELGGTESSIGFIMGAAGFSTIFTTPSVGVLVDKLGKKWFLAVGGLIMAATTLPFAYIHSLNFLFPLLRILHGAAFSLCFTAAGTLTADAAPPNKRSQALGLFGVFTIINYALAPFVGKRVVENFGFNVFFEFVFLFGLLSFLIALFIKEPVKPPVKIGETSSIFKTLSRKGVFIAAVALLISGSGFITALTFLPVFAKSIKVDSFDLFFITYTAAALVVRVFGGWIPDKIGKKRAAAPAFLFFSLSLIGLGFASEIRDFIILGVVFGLPWFPRLPKQENSSSSLL